MVSTGASGSERRPEATLSERLPVLAREREGGADHREDRAGDRQHQERRHAGVVAAASWAGFSFRRGRQCHLAAGEQRPFEVGLRARIDPEVLRQLREGGSVAADRMRPVDTAVAPVLEQS